jgi:hypothetical protein
MITKFEALFNGFFKSGRGRPAKKAAAKKPAAKDDDESGDESPEAVDSD